MHRHGVIKHKKVSADNQAAIDAVYAAVTQFYQDRLDFFKKVSSSPDWNQLILQSERSLKTAGKLVDWSSAYNNNPYSDVDSSVYATASLMSQILNDHLYQLGFSSVFGDAMPATYLIATSQLIDSFYPELSGILDREREWYQNLATPLERQTALEAMQAHSVSDSYGIVINVQGLLDINHSIMSVVHEFEDWGKSTLSKALQGWKEYLGDNMQWWIGDAALMIGDVIDRSLAFAGLTEAIMIQFQLPLNEAQALIAMQFLDNSGFDVDYEGPSVNYEEISSIVNNAISQNELLKQLKNELEKKNSLEERLAFLKEQQALSQQGYQQTMMFGQALEQFGALVKMPGLVRSAQVFQYGVKIISNLKCFSQLGVILSHLPLGPVSTIASSVMGVIQLFSGKSPEQRMAEQLNQIQQSLNQIMESQVVIYQAINQSYYGLLEAIRSGLGKLTETMLGQFDQVTDEFFILNNNIDALIKNILDELHRLEMSIEQERLLPFRSAIDSVLHMGSRHPRDRDESYLADVRHALQSLENWGTEQLCDPSFTGDVESDYDLRTSSYKNIARHLGSKSIHFYRASSELGYLFKTALNMVGKSDEIIVCNYQLWSKALIAYHELISNHVDFEYDPKGELRRKMFLPAENSVGLVNFFQENLFESISVILAFSKIDFQYLGNAINEDVKIINEVFNKSFKIILESQIPALVGLRDNLPGYHGKYKSHIDGRYKEDVFKEFLNKLIAVLDSRINNPSANYFLPLNLMAKGSSLIMRELTLGSNDLVQHELETPVALAFPEVLFKEKHIPTAFVKGQLLGNGNMMATFRYEQSEWLSGDLKAHVDLNFVLFDSTSIPIASVLWTGRPQLRSNAGQTDRNLLTLSQNVLPLSPWDAECKLQPAPYHACLMWSSELTYLIEPTDPRLSSLISLNRQKVKTQIDALGFASYFANKGKLSAVLESLTAKWQLFKAFSLVSGVSSSQMDEMNKLNLHDLMIDVVNKIEDYDPVTGVISPDLTEAFMSRISPYFDRVLHQSIAYRDGRSDSLAPEEKLHSPLKHLVDRLMDQTHLVTEVANIRQSLRTVRNPYGLIPMKPINRIKSETRFVHSKHVVYAVNEQSDGLSKTSVFLLSGLAWLPIFAIVNYARQQGNMFRRIHRQLWRQHPVYVALLGQAPIAEAQQETSLVVLKEEDAVTTEEQSSLFSAVACSFELGLARGFSGQLEEELVLLGFAPNQAALYSSLLYTVLIFFFESLRLATTLMLSDPQELDLALILSASAHSALRSVIVMHLLVLIQAIIEKVSEVLENLGAKSSAFVLKQTSSVLRFSIYVNRIGEEGLTGWASQMLAGAAGEACAYRLMGS
jgi:hypothetical protein